MTGTEMEIVKTRGVKMRAVCVNLRPFCIFPLPHLDGFRLRGSTEHDDVVAAGEIVYSVMGEQGASVSQEF